MRKSPLIRHVQRKGKRPIPVLSAEQQSHRQYLQRATHGMQALTTETARSSTSVQNTAKKAVRQRLPVMQQESAMFIQQEERMVWRRIRT